MRKFLLVSAAIFGLASSSAARNALAASGSEVVALSEAQIQAMQDRQSALLEAQLAGIKAGLKLDDEQARTWSAFEEAIGEAAQARWDRTREARTRMTQPERPSSLERLSIMSDHLEKSSAELRKVVDATKPPFDSLTDGQK
jgi:type II secretory pathway pseudopilin PulG